MTSALLYEIRIQGHLREDWADWFDGLEMQALENGETLLRGEVIDQAALHGLLNRIRDLHLTLLEVRRLKPEPGGRNLDSL